MILKNKAPLLFGAKRIGDVVSIYTKEQNRNRRRREARFLGCGKFTCAFSLTTDPSKVFLYTFYGDHSKDILAYARKLRNPHLPVIDKVGDIDHKGLDVQVYLTKLYKMAPTRADMGEVNYMIMKALQLAHRMADAAIKGDLITNLTVHAFNEHVVNNARVHDNVKLALEHIHHSCANWGDHYLFDDFRKANLGLDHKNNLVLVDPIFDAEKVYNDVLARMEATKLFKNQK